MTKFLQLLLAAVALALAAAPAAAQSGYPSKPVKIVVPAPAGTGPDIMARLYAEHLGRALGQQFLVENKAGASGNIGAEAVARSPADGHTLLYAYNQIPTMNPHLFGKLGYDMQKDLAPISMTLATGYVLLANNNFPGSTLAEAIAYARSNPGKVAYASYGPGTASHLAFEIIQDQTKAEFLHVPYKQGQVTDVIAGQVAMVFEPFPSALPFVASGKTKALAVTTPKRLAALPGTPTMSEAVPGFDLLGWQGVWAPTGTPPEVLAKLQSEFARITQLPEMQKRIRDLASEPVGSSSREMAQAIQTEYARWGQVIRAKNIRLD
ncbi:MULTISPECIES: Bug family tripartite tricarboxylate transporter substrate binding protein [Ramlibacter]|uniref:Tripartite tricarboxylate transporter substrate binding protein n=1 Tax=Ramlibacter pinisoli TaxID=2682844 RepID=A0A6N8IUM3_9BURK|nr:MULTISPECIES: tripartite tricarboxylate transporter substrate binding protein [Ramlibacter]MBA2965675.1 tripartite tricarboxylate transporter substrate binding protein [Ramlibacter sp. CGMCC 1.13660]MVQ30641.1 tripartite tricarboxylate transporter substrate binding protein [Ramlibacter pinisoli]